VSLDFLQRDEPAVLTEELCRFPGCKQPMMKRGATLTCSSGQIAHPVRVALPARTRGDVFNDLGDEGVVRDERFSDLWTQYSAR